MTVKPSDAPRLRMAAIEAIELAVEVIKDFRRDGLDFTIGGASTAEARRYNIRLGGTQPKEPADHSGDKRWP